MNWAKVEEKEALKQPKKSPSGREAAKKKVLLRERDQSLPSFAGPPR
jgi:hypothetical protein